MRGKIKSIITFDDDCIKKNIGPKRRILLHGQPGTESPYMKRIRDLAEKEGMATIGQFAEVPNSRANKQGDVWWVATFDRNPKWQPGATEAPKPAADDRSQVLSTSLQRYRAGLMEDKAYEKHKKWRAKNKDKVRAQTRKHDKNNKDQHAARQRTYQAKLDGKVKEPKACSMCGNTTRKLEADHHKGYKGDNKNKIRWICTKCHMKHQKRGRIVTAMNESWEALGIANPLNGPCNSKMQLISRGMDHEYITDQIARSNSRMQIYIDNELHAIADKEQHLLNQFNYYLSLWNEVPHQPPKPWNLADK